MAQNGWIGSYHRLHGWYNMVGLVHIIDYMDGTTWLDWFTSQITWMVQHGWFGSHQRLHRWDNMMVHIIDYIDQTT